MSQMTCSGSGSGELGNQFAATVGMRVRSSASTSRRARSRTDASIRATTFGVNALLTIDAQPLVPRIVERDHRAEELRYLGCEVAERDVRDAN